MKRVILCPNPYRDGELTVAKHSKEILEAIGFETVVCLPSAGRGMTISWAFLSGSCSRRSSGRIC